MRNSPTEACACPVIPAIAVKPSLEPLPNRTNASPTDWLNPAFHSGGDVSRPLTIHALLAGAASSFPTAPAIYGVDRDPLTYSGLLNHVQRTVESLNGMG